MKACALIGQPSSPPACKGSKRSDFHLCEVQGHQVALPRLPIDALVRRVGRKKKTESKIVKAEAEEGRRLKSQGVDGSRQAGTGRSTMQNDKH